MRDLPTQAGAAAIELRRVHARYRADRSDDVVRDVSLAVRAGELVCVLGPNGAGKSTLLRVLSGTLAPSSGEALLFGAPMTGLDRRDVARVVAVVGQTNDVAFGFSVREVVAMGRAPHLGGWMRAGAEDDAIVDDVMARCDLVHLAARRADELSGGEQKRVAIARALAQKPRVLLLDEPGAFLDLEHQIALYDLLAAEVARAELACVTVTHDLNVTAQYASRAVLVRAGAIACDGPIDEVMTVERLGDVFGVDLLAGTDERSGARFFVARRRGGAAVRAPAGPGARAPSRS